MCVLPQAAPIPEYVSRRNRIGPKGPNQNDCLWIDIYFANFVVTEKGPASACVGSGRERAPHRGHAKR